MILIVASFKCEKSIQFGVYGENGFRLRLSCCRKLDAISSYGLTVHHIFDGNTQQI